LSRFLKSPGSVTARKFFGNEFHADGPAYVKACSPNLVRNWDREFGRRGRGKTGTWVTAVDETHDVRCMAS